MSKETARKQREIAEVTPKYVLLAQRLLRHISDKGLGPGDRLGTEFELMRRYGVSRVTVRQALMTLEQDGYLSRERARGTFVRKSVKQSVELSLTRGCIVLACSNDQASHAEEDTAFVALLRSLEQALTKRGFKLQVLSFGSDEASDRTRLTELVNRDDIEGICAIGSCLESYRPLFPGIPLVTSCAWRLSTSAPLVNPDTKAACRTSIDYLLGHGHRDIAMLCSSSIGQEAFSLFATAYKEAFSSRGLECPRQLVHQAYPGESLQSLAAQLLKGPPRPTAIFAENWKVCEAVLAAAHEQGIRVPHDLSLIAFGRNVLQISYPLAVTAYVPDHEKIGQRAAEVLTIIIDGESVDDESLTVPGKLIERDSVRSLAASETEEEVT